MPHRQRRGDGHRHRRRDRHRSRHRGRHLASIVGRREGRQLAARQRQSALRKHRHVCSCYLQPAAPSSPAQAWGPAHSHTRWGRAPARLIRRGAAARVSNGSGSCGDGCICGDGCTQPPWDQSAAAHREGRGHRIGGRHRIGCGGGHRHRHRRRHLWLGVGRKGTGDEAVASRASCCAPLPPALGPQVNTPRWCAATHRDLHGDDGHAGRRGAGRGRGRRRAHRPPARCGCCCRA